MLTSVSGTQCDFCSSPNNLFYFSCKANHTYHCCSACSTAVQKKFKIMILGSLKTIATPNRTVLHAPSPALLSATQKYYKKSTVAAMDTERWCLCCLQDLNTMSGYPATIPVSPLLQTPTPTTWDTAVKDTLATKATVAVVAAANVAATTAGNATASVAAENNTAEVCVDILASEAAAAAAATSDPNGSFWGLSNSTVAACDFCCKDQTQVLVFGCASTHSFQCCSSCLRFTQEEFKKMIQDPNLHHSVTTANGTVLHAPPLKALETHLKQQKPKKCGSAQTMEKVQMNQWLDTEQWCLSCMQDLPNMNPGKPCSLSWASASARVDKKPLKTSNHESQAATAAAAAAAASVAGSRPLMCDYCNETGVHVMVKACAVDHHRYTICNGCQDKIIYKINQAVDASSKVSMVGTLMTRTLNGTCLHVPTLKSIADLKDSDRNQQSHTW